MHRRDPHAPGSLIIFCALLFWRASITFCSSALTSRSSINTSTIRQFIPRNIPIVKDRWIHSTSPADYCSSLKSYEDKTVIPEGYCTDMKRTWLKKISYHMQRSGAHYDALTFRFSPFRLRFSNAQGRGVLLGILGGGVPPGSPNPDPISDQKM